MATAAAESLPGVWPSILVILMETVSPLSWQSLIVKPVLLACLKFSGDFGLSTFCSDVCVYTYWTICLLQQDTGMDMVPPACSRN